MTVLELPPEWRESSPRVCRECGCGEFTPCYDELAGGACAWVEEDLCSACADGEWSLTETDAEHAARLRRHLLSCWLGVTAVAAAGAPVAIWLPGTLSVWGAALAGGLAMAWARTTTALS